MITIEPSATGTRVDTESKIVRVVPSTYLSQWWGSATSHPVGFAAR
jgi:hypothetical protein